jgi:transposase
MDGALEGVESSMTRSEKIAKARGLRAEGLKYRDVAEELGTSTTTIFRWLNPERTAPYRNGRACNPERTREIDREYNRRHPGKCPECGGAMARTTARAGGKCQACRQDEIDRRSRQIERWWAEGLGQREIASRLGWTINRLHVEKHRLREAGYKLPYRRSVHPTADGTPRFPEQVAA